MFLTQSYKARYSAEHGYKSLYLKLGKFALVSGDRNTFKSNYLKIEDEIINSHLNQTSTSTTENLESISKDLDFQHKFRKNNTLRAYITPEAADFSVNFGLTKYRVRLLSKLIDSIDRTELSFLELGSGSSVGTAIASKKNKVITAKALDYDAYSLKNIVPIVWSNLNVDTSKLSTHVGTFFETGQSDESIDILYAGGALHHCIDFSKAFSEAFRILKPGGLFFISDFVPHDYLSSRGRDFIFNLPHGEDEFKKLKNGQSFLTNKDVTEHFRSDIELVYNAQNAGFQTKYFKLETPSNNLFKIFKSIFSMLFSPISIRKITNFSFEKCGYDSVGNHIESGDSISISPSLFNSTAAVPGFLYKRMSLASPRFDNRLYVLRKPEENEIVPFVNTKSQHLSDVPV